jgi:hypothetical protein
MTPIHTEISLQPGTGVFINFDLSYISIYLIVSSMADGVI